jgi:methionine aminopeptidase
VQTKYREAASIASSVLTEVLGKLVPGALVADICAFGDALIEESVGKVFKNKKTMEKGIAFPTCISANETVAHYSPLKSESRTLALGDAVKVDLGVHLDGFCAVVAHTVVLGSSAEAPVTGPKADVIVAAYTAAEVALRLIKPGATNTAVTEAIEACAAAYGVRSMAGVQCSQLERFKLEGKKAVPLKKSGAGEGPYKAHTFEPHETYAVEIAFTTGEGKSRETETRTTVFKRLPEVRDFLFYFSSTQCRGQPFLSLSSLFHSLPVAPPRCSRHSLLLFLFIFAQVKTQLRQTGARKLLSEVNNRHPTLPFSLRGLPMEERDARLGITECVKAGSLSTFPVIEEREGSFTAHFRFTLLLLPGGTLKVTGLALPANVVSDKPLPPELAAILATVPYVKPVKGGGGGGGGGGGAAAPATGAEMQE